MQGFLYGKPLLGDNGAPTPKSGKKAKLTLALPRGKADLGAQDRAGKEYDAGLRDHEAARQRLAEPVRDLPKDIITSHNCPTSNPKVARNMISRAWRPGDPDGSETYALPGGNAMPVRKTRGKVAWTETPGYMFAAERADLLTATKTVKPRLDRQDRAKRDVQIIRKKNFRLAKNNS